uniref:Uncharacterized protein n=1 Tax=Tanacetum cinerariifolium TaxID=118510 RepID=A0A6L2MPY4_TANCI|nr:hypothetical protein [Tanacetum cinerariifolium]
MVLRGGVRMVVAVVSMGCGDDVGGDDVMMMMMVVDLWCNSGDCDDVEVMVWLCGGSGGSGDGDDVCLRCGSCDDVGVMVWLCGGSGGLGDCDDVWLREFVGIKSLFDAVGIIDAHVLVNTTQLELVLLVYFNEKYAK